MKMYIFVIIIYLLATSFGFSQDQPAQENQPVQDQPAQNQQNVIDLTELGKTYTISARMELPQVRMFDRRITPDFKQVSAEKSFSSELSPEAEGIQYDPITSGKVKPVDNIDELLKKKRF